MRRFSETRRPHPLAPDRSVSEGIAEERERLNAIRKMADLILDTSNLTVHELRDVFMRMSREGGSGRQEMVVNLVSFGFKAGVPMLCGTESGFSVTPYGNWHYREMEVFVKYFGLSPLEAIQCATEKGALGLRMKDQVGTVQKGRLADLLVVKADLSRRNPTT